jgi:hypothetical protein
LNDKNLFFGVADTYLKEHYTYLLRLIDDELINLNVQNDQIDQFIKDCSTLNLITTTSPPLLNLSWWPNCITIVSTALNRFLGVETSRSS